MTKGKCTAITDGVEREVHLTFHTATDGRDVGGGKLGGILFEFFDIPGQDPGQASHEAEVAVNTPRDPGRSGAIRGSTRLVAGEEITLPYGRKLRVKWSHDSV